MLLVIVVFVVVTFVLVMFGERGLIFESDLRRSWDASAQTWPGQKFHIEVYFTLWRLTAEGQQMLMGDPPVSVMDGTYEKKYIILPADITTRIIN